jgi:uncharacterized protein involved in outer membrane biogenesis
MDFVQRMRERLVALRRSRRARKLALTLGIALVVYALLGFFAVPAYLHHLIDTRAAGLLGRPVSVAALRFNPFTLKLGADQVHIGEPDGKTPFVDIDRLTLNASWTSLLHVAPVLDEVELQRPRIAIRRDAAQRFNFADLIERFAAPAPGAAGPASAAASDAPPTRFSLSNIRVHDGDIRFDDQATNTSHHVENIEIGIPFIANLPRDVDAFVQPLLAMRVDGRPLRVEGQTKPFADSLESILTFHLDRLDLPRYLGYVPAALPVAIPRGLVSGDLQLRFVQDKRAPRLDLSGILILDDFAIADQARVPIAEGQRAIAVLSDIQPLISRYRLSTLQLDHAAVHYVAQAGARSNFDALIGAGKAPPAKAPPGEVSIDSIALAASRFEYTDATLPTAATLTIDALGAAITGLNTSSGPPAEVDASGTLNGGSLATRGQLDLGASRYTGSVNAKAIGLAPLQALAAPGIAAVVQQGRADSSGNFVADWRGAFNLHIEPASVSLHDVAIGLRDGDASKIRFTALDAALIRFDLAAKEVRHGEVTVHSLDVAAQRARDGKLDLLALAAPSAPAAVKTAQAAPWHWSIVRFGIDNAALHLTDGATAKPTQIQVTAIAGAIGGLSDAMAAPLDIQLAGAIDEGRFDVHGTLKPAPLDVDLKIKTLKLDIAGLQPYLEVPLNVRVSQAQLSTDGALRYSDGPQPKLAWRGRVALQRVRVQDKLSGDDFLRWATLDLGTIDLRSGSGPLQLNLGDIALSDFYARVIMNANGRLNLSDVAGTGAAQPVSVTRAEGASLSTRADPAATTAQPATTTTTVAKPVAAIHVGQITLARGQLNYTDNFIKPNYTANITGLTGKIGAFGSSAGGAPAEVSLQGQLDDNAQVHIDGRINPLLPVAFVDIKGTANGVELTHLSAYSSKYTGYPIEKGRLNADVSYRLDQGKLKADNHLVIDQLTFGDEIADRSVAHLPVKLAVALLKDGNGQINVNVPVSGSLDDPQFSLGGLVARAFGGLILKAATSPFRLLASAFNHADGAGGEELGYVEFAPGADRLDDAAQGKLAQIAKILSDRPALNLGIIGRTDPGLDEAGLREVAVDELIHQEYLADHGAGAASSLTTLSPEDTERYLAAAYQHANFPKPKNLIGLTAAQPPEEMRKLLEANIATDASAMLHLAERRAGHIVGFLHGKLEDRRLWVLAPKLDAKGIDDKAKTTRVDFTLQ